MILVVEPQFGGAAHSLFNAALLVAITHAFPSSRLVFAAHGSHIEWVRASLPAAEVNRISEWRPLGALPRLRVAGRLRRTIAELTNFAVAFKLSIRPSTKRVIFCSITKVGIALSTLAAFVGMPPALILIHQMFQLKGREGEGQVTRLRLLLSLPHRRSQRFVMLGSAASSALSKEDSLLAGRVGSIEPPYLWHRNQVPEAPRDEAVCFGLFGKGFSTRLQPFLALSRELRNTRVKFRIVGHIPPTIHLDPDDDEALGRPAREPLSVSGLAQVAEQVHLAIWTGGEGYSLRFSASFLDCLAHVCPLIAVRTPFIEHYFNELGEIGILVADEASLKAAVSDLVQDFPERKYRDWCSRILESRRRFDSTSVAAELRRLLTADARG